MPGAGTPSSVFPSSLSSQSSQKLLLLSPSGHSSVPEKMAEKQEEPSNAQNGEPDNAEEGEGKKKKVKREDLPPFEIVTG